MNLQDQKKQIRLKIQSILDQLSFIQLIQKSQSLTDGFHRLLIQSSEIQTFQSQTIVSFCPFEGEPQINIESEKRDEPYRVSYVRIEDWSSRAMLPRECRRDQPGDWEEIEIPGGKKIFQPSSTTRIIAAEEICMILIPGLAFSPEGARLGRGAGFYDRFLKNHPEALRVGIAFSDQVIEHLPVESWDQTIDVILTDQGLITPLSMKLFGSWKSRGKLESRTVQSK